MAKMAMLGSGFIGAFYTTSLHGYRNEDRVVIVQSRNEENLKRFCAEYDVPRYTTDMEEAINDPEVDLVVVALPNHLHLDAIKLCAKAGKGVICTKPLGRNAQEAKEMLDIVEESGIFHGYMEDLAYTPKTLKAVDSVRKGAIGKVIWTRSRETHPGPHSDWFWNLDLAGGGAHRHEAAQLVHRRLHHRGQLPLQRSIATSSWRFARRYHLASQRSLDTSRHCRSIL